MSMLPSNPGPPNSGPHSTGRATAGPGDFSATDPALAGAAHALDALALADRAALRPEAAARIALAAASAARPALPHAAGRDARPDAHRRRRRVPWHLALATVVALAAAGAVLSLLALRSAPAGPAVPGPIAQASPADEAAALEESLLLVGVFSSNSNSELDVLVADAVALSVDIQFGAAAPTEFDEGSAS
jgi:hypothetical protein